MSTSSSLTDAPRVANASTENPFKNVLKSNADFIGELFELEGIAVGEKKALQHLLNVTRFAIDQEANERLSTSPPEHRLDIVSLRDLELTPLSTLEQLAQDGQLTYQQVREKIVEYLADKVVHDHMLPEMPMLETPEEQLRWSKIANQVATYGLLGNQAEEYVLAHMLNREINKIDRGLGNPTAPSLSAGYCCYANEVKGLQTPGEFVVWCIKNHPDIICDAMSDSNHSISQFLMDAKELIHHAHAVTAGKESAHKFGGGYPDIPQEKDSGSSPNISLADSVLSKNTNIPDLPETWLG